MDAFRTFANFSQSYIECPIWLGIWVGQTHILRPKCENIYIYIYILKRIKTEGKAWQA